MRKIREMYDDMPKRSDPEYMREYRKKHGKILAKREKERIKSIMEINPNYYKDKYNPLISKSYRDENKKELKEKQWMKRGIVDMTYEKYLNSLIEQDGKCYICCKNMDKPHTDHDHEPASYRPYHRRYHSED